MKYLAVIHGFNEPDNNTPADEIWAQVVEVKDEHEKIQAEKIYHDDFLEDYFAVEVGFFPLEELDEWGKVSEIW